MKHTEMVKQILDISRKLKLTHVSSNLSVLPILEEIYSKKKPEDKVLMDNAHAHLAHLVVKEDQERKRGTIFIDAEKMYQVKTLVDFNIEHFGIHCDRQAGCDATGGSLGHALGISIGMALFNPKRNIYCIVSDGSMHEGSNWEALRLIDTLKLKNIKIYCNFNGYSAVAKVDLKKLERRMKAFCKDIHIRHTKNGMGKNKVSDHYTPI